MCIKKQILFCLTALLTISAAYGAKNTIKNQKTSWKNTKLRVIPVNYRTDGYSKYGYKTLIPTRKGIEKDLVDPLVKGGISVIEWGTNAGTTVTHDSVIEPIVGSSLTPQEWKQMRKLDYLIYKNLKTMIDSGNDPLKVAISRAHELGIKIFARMEMNKGYGNVKKKTWVGTLLAGKFAKEHPEYRIPRRLDLDFKYKEVRDYKLSLLRELAEKGCDGIMADFESRPIYFADPEQGRPIMTQYMSDIRKMLDEVGAKQKRRIELFIRINYKDSYQRGLDWKACMKDGSIDYISTFGGWPSSDYFDYQIDEFVAYRDKIKSKCKVYGHIWQALGLIDTDPRPNAKRRYNKPKTVGMYIAHAALHNLSGADGLELGYASPQQWQNFLGMLGTPEKIEFADKHYMVDIKPYMPLLFSPGKKEIIKKIKLRVADNVAKAQKLGLKVNAQIMLTGSPLSPGAELVISINGKGALKLNLREDVQYAISVPGIAELSAATILAECGPLDKYCSRQLGAYSGLAPQLFHSGTSVRGCRINKRGPSRLRQILYVCSVAGGRNHSTLVALHSRITQQGKKPLQARCAVMRKLLLIVRAVVVNKTFYDKNYGLEA